MTEGEKRQELRPAVDALEQLAEDYERRGLIELAAQLRAEAHKVIIIPPAPLAVQQRLFDEFLLRQAEGG